MRPNFTETTFILDSEVPHRLSSKYSKSGESIPPLLHSSDPDEKYRSQGILLQPESLPVACGPQWSVLDRFLIPMLRDPRDTVFVKASLYFLLAIPSALYLIFGSFNWIHYLAHALFIGKNATTFVLMLHCTCHRSLYKAPYTLLNGVIPYVLGPFFGHTWDSFYFHHIKHHHIEDNGPNDLSSTLAYQRDRFDHFLIYFLKFMSLDLYRLTRYFCRKRLYTYAVRFCVGELASYTCMWWTIAHSVYPAGAVLVLVLPLLLMRFGMMSGNWAQHAFVDRARPDCDYVQSLTCINTQYNRIAFNDGYHTSHHLNPRRHWADHPGNLVDQQATYAAHGTLVFNGLDFHQVWFLLMLRNYAALAKAFVPMGPGYPTDQKGIIAFLQDRTKQMTTDEIQTYYEAKHLCYNNIQCIIMSNPSHPRPFRWPSLDTHHVWIFRLNDTILHEHLHIEAQGVARHHGLELGPNVANMPHYFWAYRKRKINESATLPFTNPHPSMVYHDPQVPKQTLFKRTALPPASVSNITNRQGIHDPRFKDQWHLYNSNRPSADINVTEVWANGFTGQNITVAIVDDGIDANALDFKDKIDFDASYDYNDHQPRPDPKLDDDYHGTRCAGEVAAAVNSVCGVGVAYSARLSGIRILSGTLLIGDEASAYVHGLHKNDIYSCSFGPDDRGFTLQAPPPPVEEAFYMGVTKGRGGKGALYVFASGNGGMFGDNCNADGYANSVYTITIGAVTDRDTRPYYSELCAAQLVASYSGGGDHYGITTTDKGVSNCSSDHSGTSAAGAGILALVLSANPELTYRTVMHLLVETAVPFGLDSIANDWHFNPGSKRNFSHYFGFGKMDSYRLVEAAKNRANVGDLFEYASPFHTIEKPIHDRFRHAIEVPPLPELKTLEHVIVVLSLQHPKRGDLEIDLISPHNVLSRLMTVRAKDTSSDGYDKWKFSSVQHWGEPAHGIWTLVLRDTRNRDVNSSFVGWQLGLRGEGFKYLPPTPGGPIEVKEPTTPMPGPSGAFVVGVIFLIILFVLLGVIVYTKRELFFWPLWNRYAKVKREDDIELGQEPFYNETLHNNESAASPILASPRFKPSPVSDDRLTSAFI